MRLGCGMSDSPLTSCSRLLQPQPSVGVEHREKGDSLLRNDSFFFYSYIEKHVYKCIYIGAGFIYGRLTAYSVSWLSFSFKAMSNGLHTTSQSFPDNHYDIC